MRLCDICKSENVKYNKTATINEKGEIKELELCGRCYNELRRTEELYRHKVYEDTVMAINGEIPRKHHWWNRFCW